MLDVIRFGAAGGILASAFVNAAFSPSQAGMWASAAVGAGLNVLIAWRMHLV